MTEAQAKKAFEEHNPISGAKRCPNGKAGKRDLLHAYALAAANLYGVIRLDEFVGIFNEQNDEGTTAEEVRLLLLPIAAKAGWDSAWYGFYEDCIAHYGVIRNFDAVDYLEQKQAGKLRFVPPKDMFLNFEREEFADSGCWEKITYFLRDAFFRYREAAAAASDLKANICYNLDVSRYGEILESRGLVFRDKKRERDFLDMLALARNETRSWHNKGHTLDEMAKMPPQERGAVEPTLHLARKIEPGEPCPCGSGKKYKKCCKNIERSDGARLSGDESYFFYATWYKLLDFVNKKLKIVDCEISPWPEDEHDGTACFKIRERLWENPKIIDEFLRGAKGLSYEETCLLRSWEERHVKGEFVAAKYLPQYAVLMHVGDMGKTRRLYGAKGITSSIAEVLQFKLPVALNAVLLPFAGRIIFDSFIIPRDIEFDKRTIEMFGSEYAELKDRHGIEEKL